MTVDASDKAIGWILEQEIDGRYCPLAFFSKQLKLAKAKYSSFDRELLALHLTIRYFRYFLEGRSVTALTDHKPITQAMSRLTDPWSARQQRHLSAISELTIDIRHISGKNNVVADALSRIAIDPAFPDTVMNMLHEEVDYEAPLT